MFWQLKNKILNAGAICGALLSIIAISSLIFEGSRGWIVGILGFVAAYPFWIILIPMSAAIVFLALERQGFWLGPMERRFFEAIARQDPPYASGVEHSAGLTTAEMQNLITRHGSGGAKNVETFLMYRDGYLRASTGIKLTAKGEKKARRCGIINN